MGWNHQLAWHAWLYIWMLLKYSLETKNGPLSQPSFFGRYVDFREATARERERESKF